MFRGMTSEWLRVFQEAVGLTGLAAISALVAPNILACDCLCDATEPRFEGPQIMAYDPLLL